MWWSVVVVVALGVACGGTETSSECSPTNGGATTTSVGSIADDVLVGIMQATIGASSAMADIGNQRASNANVRSFIKGMRTDMTNAKANLMRLAAGAGITPAPSDVATQITAASQTQIATLAAMTAEQFDEGFVESVDEAQTTAAANFASRFVGASGDDAINQFAAGLERALEFEAGFADALRGNFDASAFLATQRNASTVPTVSGGGTSGGQPTPVPPTSSTPSNPSPPPSSPSRPSTPSTPNTGNNGTGTSTGSASDMGSPGTGSGSGQGLGGSGTATGLGQDPGSAVGTGTSSTSTNG